MAGPLMLAIALVVVGLIVTVVVPGFGFILGVLLIVAAVVILVGGVAAGRRRAASPPS